MASTAEVMKTRRWTGVQELLGRLSPGVRPLEGKTFYLDEVKSCHPGAVLVEVISCLGGKVESFLHKDISYVVSWRGRGSGQEQGGNAGASGSPTSLDPRDSQRPSSSSRRRQCPEAARRTVCASRGKALLEKAIANSGRCQGSSVLPKACSWGVKIVHGDDFLECIHRLTAQKSMDLEKSSAKSSLSRIVRAGALKPPFLKIEDSSRKYRPLHLQSMIFPMLDYTGRFSPFEAPVPPPPPKRKEQDHYRVQDRSGELLSAPQLARRKAAGYCECCQLRFSDQDEHLQLEQHRRFVQDAAHYRLVDQLVALLPQAFVEVNTQDPALLRLPSPQALDSDPFVDLEPQGDSDTEKVIQNLLSASCPLQTAASPPLVAPHENKFCAESPSRMAATLSCEEQVDTNPILPDSMTPDSAVSGFVCLRSVPVCGVGTGEEEPAEDDSLQRANPMKTSKGPEDDLISSGCPPAFNCPSSKNPRKRSRSWSSNPGTTKKQRTTLQPVSDLTKASLTLLSEPLSSTFSSPGYRSSPGLASAMGVDEVALAGDGKPYRTSQEVAVSCGRKASLYTSVSCLNQEVCHSAVHKEDPASEPCPRVTLGDILEPPCAVPLPPLGVNAHQLPLSLRGALDPFTGAAVCSQHFPFPLGFDPHLCHPFPPDCDIQDSSNPPSNTFSSVCTEALIPDLSACSPSSNSDWDRGVLPQVSCLATGGCCVLDAELLQRPCSGMQDSTYESRLRSVLHRPDAGPAGSCQVYGPCLGAVVLRRKT